MLGGEIIAAAIGFLLTGLILAAAVRAWWCSPTWKRLDRIASALEAEAESRRVARRRAELDAQARPR